VGIVLIAKQLFGGQLVSAIWDRIEFEFGKVQFSDIKFRYDEILEESYVLLNLRLHFKQTFGVTDTLTNLVLSFKQQNMLLGYTDYRALVVVPDGEWTEIPFALHIPSGPFLDRLQAGLTLGNNNSLLAPVEISGTAHLASGIRVPISSSISLNDILI